MKEPQNPTACPNVKGVHKVSNTGYYSDYYNLEKFGSVIDMIEYYDYNYSQGNILKVATTMAIGRHSGTDYKRDLQKLIYFGQRELNRIATKEVKKKPKKVKKKKVKK